jgi:hypothetical protein
MSDEEVQVIWNIMRVNHRESRLKYWYEYLMEWQGEEE